MHLYALILLSKFVLETEMNLGFEKHLLSFWWKHISAAKWKSDTKDYISALISKPKLIFKKPALPIVLVNFDDLFLNIVKVSI